MKEFLADIDVAMGGRVAEELSEFSLHAYILSSSNDPILAVYGTDNVTSGCSSDLRQATNIATEMVKVRVLIACSLISRPPDSLIL